ncbi:MAG TPA: hypothetical protein VIN34_06015 [Candidatus Limnocylindria bacterium]|jgi:hypothetical protein
MTAEAVTLLVAVVIPLGTLAILVQLIREMRELERSLDELIELRASGR